MNKRIALIATLLFGAMLVSACAPYETQWFRHQVQIPRCEKSDVFMFEALPGSVYQPRCSNSCAFVLPPFDHAGWFESKFTSQRIRGRAVLPLGCVKCGDDGGCNTVTFNFDFTKIQEDAQICSAKLAVPVVDNLGNMGLTVLRGRVNVGSDWAVIAENPEIIGQWVLYDITKFACRAVLERRNSAALELSLPCTGLARAKVATVAMSMNWSPKPGSGPTGPETVFNKTTEPRIIIELR